MPRRQSNGNVLLYGYFVPSRPLESPLKRLLSALGADARATRGKWTAWFAAWQRDPIDPRTGIPLSEPNVTSDVQLASARYAGTHFEYLQRVYESKETASGASDILPMAKVRRRKAVRCLIDPLWDVSWRVAGNIFTASFALSIGSAGVLFLP